jgi:hypothetical protein
LPLPDTTPEKHRGLRPPWKAGESGNPAGRPTGSHNRLAEVFVQDLYEHGREHGMAAIERMCEQDPSGYVRMVAGVIPKELLMKEQTLDDLTDAEVFEALQNVRAYLRAIGEPTSETKLN